jgi:hypothetical protein
MLSNETKLGCSGLIVYILAGGIIGAFCWPYTINTWLLFLGKTNQIVWWQGFFIGLVPYFGQISIFCAILTWVLMLFLVN